MLSDNSDQAIQAVLVATESTEMAKSIDAVLRDLSCVGVHHKPSVGLDGLDMDAFVAVFVDASLPLANELATEMKKLASHAMQFLPLVLVGSIETIAKHQMQAFEAFDDVIGLPIRKLECAIRLNTLLKRRTAISRLVHANAMLTQAQEKKKALAALVVHDLRNPLAAILGNVQLLRDESSLSVEEKQKIGEDLEALSHKAMSMVASLLDVEELEEGLLRSEPKWVELDVFFGRFPMFYRVMLDIRDITLTFKHTTVEQAWFDEELMFRVIENLLDNSVRYAPKGGQVIVECTPMGDFLQMRIANNGPAIPKSEQEKIFERYYRLDARRQGARANRGLGLYFCKLACEAQGGSIGVGTMEGYPGCFEMMLPIAPKDTEEKK